MNDVFICDAIRTPFGRYGGALASIRADDLAAIPIRALIDRNPNVDWEAVDDVIFGCANQAGEDNRNVGRMALLLAGLPETVPGTTVNRLCGSSLDAIAIGARAIKSGEADLIVAGGVESMSRAPFVLAKADAAFRTAENVAEQFQVSRQDQDAFALRSHQRWAAAHQTGFFNRQLVPVEIRQKKSESAMVTTDEHPRPDTTLEALANLRTVVKSNGTVTAGNASGINDGAGAVLLVSEKALVKYRLTPRARVVASATAGIEPRIMGMAPVPATRKVLSLANLELSQMDVIELNEAFAAQALAVMRQLGLPDDAPHVNPNGGAIAIGHPLGASGVRLATAAVNQLEVTSGRYALCMMCIGVGQGIAMILENCVGFVEEVSEEDAEYEIQPDEEDLIEVTPAERRGALTVEAKSKSKGVGTKK